MTKDVRKEQLVLLKFEKKLAGLAAFVAAGSVTAASASTKVNSDATTKGFEDIRAALVHLAEVTTQAHAAMQESVAAVGARALEAGGGMPKVSAVETVRSILGIG